MFKSDRYKQNCMPVGLAIALFGASPVMADRPPDNHGDIMIEEVWLTPSKEGERSVLRMRLVNDGQEHVYLLSVETPVATDAHLVGRIGEQFSTTFESFSVRPFSDLDLTTNHMWIELGPLARDLSPGDSVLIELVFLRGRLQAEAHVHDANN